MKIVHILTDNPVQNGVTYSNNNMQTFITHLKQLAQESNDRQVIRHSIGLLKALQTTNVDE